MRSRLKKALLNVEQKQACSTRKSWLLGYLLSAFLPSLKLCLAFYVHKKKRTRFYYAELHVFWFCVRTFFLINCALQILFLKIFKQTCKDKRWLSPHWSLTQAFCCKSKQENDDNMLCIFLSSKTIKTHFKIQTWHYNYRGTMKIDGSKVCGKVDLPKEIRNKITI